MINLPFFISSCNILSLQNSLCEYTTRLPPELPPANYTKRTILSCHIRQKRILPLCLFVTLTKFMMFSVQIDEYPLIPSFWIHKAEKPFLPAISLLLFQTRLCCCFPESLSLQRRWQAGSPESETGRYGHFCE